MRCSNFRSSIKAVYRLVSTVGPLKTDTLQDRPKCPSKRGVRLIEVLNSLDIRQNEFQVELIVVGQALININMN